MSVLQNPRTWVWNFGDGSEYSDRYEENPYHFYAEPVTYTVSLTVTNAYGTDSITKTGYVTVVTTGCVPPTPYFQLSDYDASDGIYIDEVVTFHDLSSGCPTDWTWYFGDGSTSSLQYPTHSYSYPGEYDITLYAANECGSSKKQYSKLITVSDPDIEADFTSNVTATNGTYVEFYDNSTGKITEWQWSFGDGTYSYEQNPIHVYPPNKTCENIYYDVSLTVESGAYSDAEVKSNYITIEPTIYDDDYPDPPTPGELFLDKRYGRIPLTENVVLYNINKQAP